ncbi:hypothetical protein D3C71_1954220 [compost metagenome]
MSAGASAPAGLPWPGLAMANRAMPTTAQPTATQVRGATFSRRKAQLITATAAGMLAMVTPAVTALVRLTP